MPYVAHSRERKAEVCALARVVGVEQASEQTGVKGTTIRRWLDAAGLSAGGSELDPDELARFERLAYAKLEGDLVSGRITGQRLATTWGIVRDKLDGRNREPKPIPSDVTSASVYVDAIEGEFPGWRTDLVARHDGDAVSAFMGPGLPSAGCAPRRGVIPPTPGRLAPRTLRRISAATILRPMAIPDHLGSPSLARVRAESDEGD